MRALVAGAGVAEVVDRPDPRPEPGEVVLAVHSCGICGSDVHSVEAGITRGGQILGHEFSGTVRELGAGVTGLREGQAVAVNPLGGCGSCAACGQEPFIPLDWVASVERQTIRLSESSDDLRQELERSGTARRK